MNSEKLIFRDYDLYQNVMCNFENILNAYNKAHRGKSLDIEVIEFDKHKMYNLKHIQTLLLTKSWDKIFKYYQFIISRPKERIVDAMTFEGRIVQHILCDNILKDYFERTLVYTNSACRENKGTDFAIKKTREYLNSFYRHNKEGYILKLDIHKYFPSIDRTILKKKLSTFPNEDIKSLLNWLIDNAPGENGIPIGNQTSQWFALIYLDEIDKLIKEQFKAKYYVRYMDDFFFLSNNKQKLQNQLKYLRCILKKHLNLQLNPKSQIIKLSRGFSFLGWRFVYKNKLLMKVDRNKLLDRKVTLKLNQQKYYNKEISKDNYYTRCLCMKNNMRKGNTYKLIRSLSKKYVV